MGRPAILLAVALAAGAGAWCARGALAVTDASGAASRLGVLPAAWQLPLLIAAAAALLFLARPAAMRVLPLLLPAVLLLPWLPGRVPEVFLVWAGQAAVAVWAVALVGVVLTMEPGPVLAGLRRRAADPARAPVYAALLAVVLLAAAAWRTAPTRPGGDEPHYLIITQSLLKDGDLRIENNHRRGDYLEYMAGELPPHYLRRGLDGEIYSVHAPGLPALILPVFALFGYRGVALALVVAAAAATGLAWRLAWRVTGQPGAAWFGWAAVTLSAPFVFHAFSVYPDGPAGIIVLAGVWALIRAADASRPLAGTRFWLLQGCGLALLPWLHTRFAALAASLGVLLLIRLAVRPQGMRRAAALFAVPLAGAAGWFGFFYAIYGTPNPSAPYGGIAISAVEYMTGGIGGLLFDHQFGLVPNAPVYLVAGLGLIALARARGPLSGRLALELAVVMVPYLLVVIPMRMWWGGWSAPARFAVPLLLPLAIPAAVFWASARTQASRALAVSALAASALITAALVIVDRGRLAYNVRDGYGLLADWANPVVSLAEGLPSFHRGTEAAAFLHAGVWLACLGAAWLALRGLERAGARSRGALALGAPACLAAAAMLALASVWTLAGTRPGTPSAAQLRLLQRVDPEGNQLAVAYSPLALLPPAGIPGRLSIASSARYLESLEEEALYAVAPVPAGSYRLRVEASEPAGTLALGIGPDWFPIDTLAVDGREHAAVLALDFPVAVRSLIVRGEGTAQRAVSRVTLEPVAAGPLRREWRDRRAWQAVRYGGTTVYFLDRGASPEQAAFWVRGGQRTSVLLVPDTPGAPVRLVLRNAPVPNRVTVESGKWRRELALAPGEQMRLDVPVAADRTAAALVRIHAASGFRPADVEPSSADVRFLGVWVAVR